jgi:hypothetical protein
VVSTATNEAIKGAAVSVETEETKWVSTSRDYGQFFRLVAPNVTSVKLYVAADGYYGARKDVHLIPDDLTAVKAALDKDNTVMGLNRGTFAIGSGQENEDLQRGPGQPVATTAGQSHLALHGGPGNFSQAQAQVQLQKLKAQAYAALAKSLQQMIPQNGLNPPPPPIPQVTPLNFANLHIPGAPVAGTDLNLNWVKRNATLHAALKNSTKLEGENRNVTATLKSKV